MIGIFGNTCYCANAIVSIKEKNYVIGCSLYNQITELLNSPNLMIEEYCKNNMEVLEITIDDYNKILGGINK